MTLRHLKIFKEAAKAGNFTHAAKRLYLTQSAVSHAISELEKEAGTVLFDRMPKSIQLTRAGELLLREAEPLLASSERLEKRLPNLEKEAVIHIASSITIAIYHLPKMIAAYEKKWPRTDIRVEVVSAAAAMDQLKCGNADIALVEGIEPEEPYCGQVFSACPLRAVCAPDYPVAGRTLCIREFCRERLLLREQGSAIRDVLDSALYLAGQQAHPVWTSVNSPALINAAKAGLGITVLPELLTDEELEKGSLSEVWIEDLRLTNHMAVIWHKEKYISAPLRAFLEQVSRVGEEEGYVPHHFSY